MNEEFPPKQSLDQIRQFESRKRDHISNSLKSANQAAGLSGFQNITLVHEALPDFNLSDVGMSTQSLGFGLRTPFFVSSMTAGHSDGVAINLTLAKACAQMGWPMGVGSQRRELFDSAARSEWIKIRSEAPAALLFGNLGIAQVLRTPSEQIRSLVDSLEASGIFVHLNALQECIQPEGTPDFGGGYQALERLVKDLEVPVIVKETGCGMSLSTMKRLQNCGVAAIDVAGLGGTHWGRIEGSRGDDQTQRLAETFQDWGIPTAQVLYQASKEILRSEVWASGGVRSGLDAGKSLALGARLVGFAKPALEAALKGETELVAWMKTVEKELQIAMFCTGSKCVSDIKGKYGIT